MHPAPKNGTASSTSTCARARARSPAPPVPPRPALSRALTAASPRGREIVSRGGAGPQLPLGHDGLEHRHLQLAAPLRLRARARAVAPDLHLRVCPQTCTLGPARAPRAAVALSARRAGCRRSGTASTRVPPPPPSRTNWTRLVPPSELTGHVSWLLPRLLPHLLLLRHLQRGQAPPGASHRARGGAGRGR